jgi:DNA ligase-associated metallophosphoesterase
MLEIVLQGERVGLLPEKALYWGNTHTLIVADLHWGKSAHFRKHGIAIPGNTQRNDEIKLASLIRRYDIQRLIIAGDLFHSKHNSGVDLFEHWRNAHQQLHIDFVTGNHDILPDETYARWNLQLHKVGMDTGPFFIAHNAPQQCTQFCIHGHIHPALRISGKGRTSMKLDCFAQDKQRMILPAFGQFTGNYILEPAEFSHLYLATDNEVIQWK